MFAALILGLIALAASDKASTESRPAEWSPAPFDYDPPDSLHITDDTPSISVRMSGLRQQRLTFTDTRGERVPVLISLPPFGKGPFPTVLVAHGFSSSKEGACRQVARALAEKGMASVAIDFPFHGERPGPPARMFESDTEGAVYRNVVQAVVDLRQAIDVAETVKSLDTSKGVVLVGYSMGSWLGSLAGAADRRVNAMVLMVAGSAAVTADKREAEGPGLVERLDLVHRFDALRHNAALAHFSPRPVLMQNGKKDLLVPVERAKALFDSARQPKDIRWYESGHLLPAEAYKDAATWLLAHLDRPKR